jgi:hypothetical protein
MRWLIVFNGSGAGLFEIRLAVNDKAKKWKDTEVSYLNSIRLADASMF